MPHRIAALLLQCLLAVGAVFTTTVDAVPSELPAPVGEALAGAEIPESSVAIYVQGVDDPKPILTLNAERGFNPASVMKLLTTYAALDILGPAYRWQTEVFTRGPVVNGRLKGDLLFKGYGDPRLNQEAFWNLLRDLRERGLKDIRGDLVLDRSFFDLADEDPAAFDQAPNKPYNLTPDALLVNFRSHRVRLLAQPGRKTPRVALDPEWPGGFHNGITQGDGACGDWKENITFQTGPVLRFGGVFPSRCEDKSMYLVLQEPDAYFGNLFRELWQQLGGTWRGRVVRGNIDTQARRWSQFASPPLADVIRDINKFSNNVMARHLFLTVGATLRAPPADTLKAREAIDDWLAVKGEHFLELVLENGSGLSRKERISARHLGWLLASAYHSSVFSELESSLPIVATDGTMRKRLLAGEVAGHAHIKSGSLQEVRAIAGYVYTARGQRVIVVCLINHPNAELGRAAQDALLSWVYAH